MARWRGQFSARRSSDRYWWANSEWQDEPMGLTRAQQREVAGVLRDLLSAVERGELSVDGPAGNALVRRLEGALLVLDALTSRADR